MSGMPKVIAATYIPSCDICGSENGAFDVPTIHGGSWANLCGPCLPIHGKNIHMGTEKCLDMEESDDPYSDIEQNLAEEMGMDVEDVHEMMKDLDMEDFI